MRFDTLKSALTAAAVAAALAPAAWAEEPGVKRLVPGGADGDRSYYVAQCRDRTRGTVVLRHADERVCATAEGGRERCQAGWTIDQAAEHACKSKKSR